MRALNGLYKWVVIIFSRQGGHDMTDETRLVRFKNKADIVQALN